MAERTKHQKSLSLREMMWLACAALIPIVVLPPASHSVELPKVLLLRGLVLILVVVTVTDETLPRIWRVPQYRQIAWIAGIYLLSLAISTLFSPNLFLSLWGNYRRQQGFIMQLSYILLFICGLWGVQTGEQRKRLWDALVLGSLPVVAVGIVQMLRQQPSHALIDLSPAIASSLGANDHFGSYLVLVIPLTVYKVVTGIENAKKGASNTQLAGMGYTFLLICQVVCLYGTQAKASWLGFLVALGFLVKPLTTKIKQPRQFLGWLVIALILVFSLLVFRTLLPGSTNQNMSFSRLVMTFIPTQDTIKERLIVWQTVIGLVRQRPLFGFGLDTLGISFTRAFPPALVYLQTYDPMLDRAGNVWLDLVYHSGFTGLCAGIALWLTITRSLLPSYRSTRRVTDTLQIGVISAALAGHLTELIFTSDTTSSSTVVWLIAVLVVSGDLPAVSRPGYGRKQSLRILHIAQYILAAVLVVLVVVQPVRADFAYNRSQDWSTTDADRFDAANQSVRIWPMQPEYWQGLAVASAHVGDLITAHNAIDRALSLEPDNPHIYALWGDLLTGVLYNTPGTISRATLAYQTAVQLAPTVAGYHTSLGVTLARQQDYQQSRLVLERAVILDPTEPVAYAALAATYEALGETELAQRAKKQASEWASQQ